MKIFDSLKKELSFCFTDTEISSMFQNEDKPIFDMSNIALTQKQKDVIFNIDKYHHDFLILHGATRSGKTFLALYLFVDYILKSPAHSIFIASGNTILTITNNLTQMLRKLGFSDYSHNKKFNVIRIDDKEIYLVGADNSKSFAKIRGGEATGWYANEVTLQDEDMLGECFRRLSDISGRIVVWDCNPSHPIHYIYQNFILKAEKVGAYEVSFKTIDNTDNLPHNYISNQERVLSERSKRLFLQGEWVGDSACPFIELKTIDYDYNSFQNSTSLKIAFLDPATGVTGLSSDTALTIMFETVRFGEPIIIFFGFLFKGGYQLYLDKMFSILKQFNVDFFYYEHNLIGENTIEMSQEVQKYNIPISSIRNTRPKLSRISTLIAPIEKHYLIGCHLGEQEFLESVKNAELSEKSHIKLDAIDSLESCYRIMKGVE